MTQLSFDAATLTGPALRLLDPELSHRIGILSAKYGLFPHDPRPDPASLEVELWGLTFSNPLGLAAGFDKSAEAVPGVLGLGFGFVEVGSVTPLPQPGNPAPRCFRLKPVGAIINRYGFNNDGCDAVAERLARFRDERDARRRKKAAAGGDAEAGAGAPGAAPREGAAVPVAPPATAPSSPSPPPSLYAPPRRPSSAAPSVDRTAVGVVGVNLGKNKATADGAADFATGAGRLAPLADYLVVNVSSPNTPGLRALQGRDELRRVLGATLAARDAAARADARAPPPLLLKIAPDLAPEDRADVAAVALETGVDGLIVSNTTIERPESVRGVPGWDEAGGLSGRPLMEPSTALLAEMYALTGGRIPIVGSGGIFSAEDAYRKIRAGASLVQIYTGLVYEGPALVPRIKKELAELLARDGFDSVADAVGVDVHIPKKTKWFWAW